MKPLGVLMLLMLLMPFSYAWAGFVGVKLWAWFCVPLGLPSLGILQFIGVSLIAGYFQPIPKSDDEKEPGDVLTSAIAAAIAKPLMFLAIGYAVHLFL